MNKEIAKVLSKLTALKNNLPKSHNVEGKYAHEFNECLKRLEAVTEEDLSDFVIQNSEIRPRVVMVSSRGKTYSSEVYVDREFILMKIDGVLGYFTLLLQPEEKSYDLGFRVGIQDK